MQLEKKHTEFFSQIIASFWLQMGPSAHSPFRQRWERGSHCVFCPMTSHPCVLARTPQKHTCHILSEWVGGNWELEISYLFFLIKEGLFCQSPSDGEGVWVWQVSLFVAGRPRVMWRQTERDQSWLVPSLIQWPRKVNFPDTVLWFTAFIPPVLPEHRTTFNFTSVISRPQTAEI